MRFVFGVFVVIILAGCELDPEVSSEVIKSCTLIAGEDGIRLGVSLASLDDYQWIDAAINGSEPQFGDCSGEYPASQWADVPYNPSVFPFEGTVYLNISKGAPQWPEYFDDEAGAPLAGRTIRFSIYGRNNCLDEPVLLYDSGDRELSWSKEYPNGEGCPPQVYSGTVE